MRRAVEIILASELDPLLAYMNYAAPGGMRPDEIIRRWLAMGMSVDLQKPIGDTSRIVDRHMRVSLK